MDQCSPWDAFLFLLLSFIDLAGGSWTIQKLLFHADPLIAPLGREAWPSLLEMRGLTVGNGHFPPQMVGIGHSGDGGVGDGVERLSQSYRRVYLSIKVKCWVSFAFLGPQSRVGRGIFKL